MKSGWEEKTLGDVCEIKPPKSEVRTKLKQKDSVSFVPMEDLGIDQKYLRTTKSRALEDVEGSYTYFADGDVLLAKITPCFENGKLGIASKLVNGIGFGSSEYFVFRPGKNLDKEYLYYFLSQHVFRENGAKSMTGAVGHKRVGKDFIEQTLLPIPPLSEQKRIVSVLDNAFGAISSVRRNAERSLEIEKELLDSFVEREFNINRNKCVESTIGDESDLSFGFAFESKKYSRSITDLKLLRGDNITPGALRWDDVKRWPKNDLSEYKKFELRENDLVLAMDRPWVGAGLKLAIIGRQDLPSLQVQRTARLRCKSGIRPRFLYQLMKREVFVSHILGSQTGLGVPHISGKQIMNFSFQKPPLQVQDNILGRIEMMEKRVNGLRKAAIEKLENLRELKESLLEKSFAGELLGTQS